MTPELVYDADCGFCTRAAVLLSREATAFPVRAWQDVPDLAELGLTPQDVMTAAYWRTAQGDHRGADAIARALVARGGPSTGLGRLLLFAPVRPLAKAVYGLVARHRHRLPGGSAACRLPTSASSS